MKILIIGATGFIGRALVRELEEAGHEIYAVTRNMQKARNKFSPSVSILEWDGAGIKVLSQHIDGKDAVVNLAGENLASGRWTAKRKKIITSSRVRTSQLLAEAIRLTHNRPTTLIQGSAIGIYGSPVDSPSDESLPAGKGFIAGLTRDWETAVVPVTDLIERVVFVRTGLVLGCNEGLLQKMLLPFRFGFGTILGNGRQYMSWIHISDQVSAMRYLIENKTSSGTYNLTGPNPIMMRDFIKTIGKIRKTKIYIRIPSVIISVMLGKMGQETVLASQNIFPARLIRDGYSFRYSNPETALKDLLYKKNHGK